MKLSDIADMREYLDNRCYCPGEIYDSSGFFYQVFDPDTECKIICEGIRNEIHGKFVVAQANEKTKPQIIYIQISDGTVEDCRRFDATDNNIKLIKGFMVGKYKKVFLDEYKESDTEKTLQEVFSIVDAIMI